MKNVGVAYHEFYEKHDTGYHPERAERVIHTKNQLEELDLFGDGHKSHFHTIIPRLAELTEIQWCHSPQLIEKIQQLSTRAQKWDELLFTDGIYGDTIISGSSFRAARYAIGGNFQAIDDIMSHKIDRSFILCRPPGHHANNTEARGFCFFNNIILAAEYLIHKWGLKKVAIVDFDAHAGNGSEEILNNRNADGEILFFSIHQHPATLYPGTCFVDEIGEGKQKGKTVNLTVLPYSGQKCIQNLFNQIINPMMEEFKPEFILVSAGYDSHHADTLTAMGLMDQTYSYIIQELAKMSSKFAKNRIQCTLEGGYNLVAIGNSIANTINSLAEDKVLFVEDDNYDESQKGIEFTMNQLIPELQDHLKPFWSTF
ncbi:histone deacetylase [Candidatus Lokiarchaeum ossiferum]|uniref:histone deacetylase n=1 Tax=Candidatus Lokiarchaeum ossiferum TaxID=2951803 RepID=UPI00352DAE93